ncbi:MAG: hypothetical protein WA547_06445 [Thermoplasmata archaeon]
MGWAELSMKELDARDVLMYIKSEDTIVKVLPPDSHEEFVRAYRANGYSTMPSYPAAAGRLSGYPIDQENFANKPVRAKELPEAEEDAIRRAWDQIRAKGKTLHVVDVGKESALRRVIEEHLHHLHQFPVLVRPDGRRLEGIQSFTAEALDKFLSD